jgi:hypothetical protein
MVSTRSRSCSTCGFRPLGRRDIDPIAAQGEAEDRLDERQHSVGEDSPFQSLEEVADVRAADVDDLAVAPRRENVHFEAPLLEPPAVILWLGHDLDPMLRHGTEGPFDSLGAPAPRNRGDKLQRGSPRLREVHAGIAAKLLVYGPPAGAGAEYPRFAPARPDAQAEAGHLHVRIFLLALCRRLEGRHLGVR